MSEDTNNILRYELQRLDSHTKPKHEPIISSLFEQKYTKQINSKNTDILHFWYQGEDYESTSQVARERQKPYEHTHYRYDPRLTIGLACYMVATNEVLVGPSLVGCSDVSLQAILAHEKTHAIFSELTLEDQRTLIDAILARPEMLTRFYQVLRRGYTHDYFGHEAALRRKILGTSVGKTILTRMEYLPNNGTVEQVDVVRVVNELIAYANTQCDPKDDLGKDELLAIAYIMAREILQHLDPKAQIVLSGRFLYPVHANQELDAFLLDPDFQAARSKYKLFSLLTVPALLGLANSNEIT